MKAFLRPGHKFPKTRSITRFLPANLIEIFNDFKYKHSLHRKDPAHTCSELPQSSEHFEGAVEDVKLLLQNMTIQDDFVTPEEEDILFKEVEPYLKRLRYETSHWDDAIHGYRETEKKNWTKNSLGIIQRIKQLAFKDRSNLIEHVHVLDLAKSGHIKPHIDSIRFCGDTIAGLSLLSSSVMRLAHEKNPSSWVKVLLKRRSLYVMTGIARFEYTHEVLPEKDSFFKGIAVERDRRISIICRNEPTEEESSPKNFGDPVNKDQQT